MMVDNPWFIIDNWVNISDYIELNLENEAVHQDTIVIPEGVRVLAGTGLFEDIDWLTNIVFPNTLERIEGYALYDNYFKSINLPNSLRYIGDSAFSCSNNLTEIVLPEGLEYIDANAFNNCHLLERIYVPSTVSYIGEDAFSAGVSLTTIIIASGDIELTFGGDCLMYGANNMRFLYLPERVKGFGENAFNNGFSAITHCYSATSGFHKVNQKVHVGITQLAYGIDDIYAELIGDGCHVPKELLRLMLKVKGSDRICLVSDAMRAAGTNVTESYLGAKVPENRVIIDDGVAKLPDKSFFAGSIATLDVAVRFAVKKAGVPLEIVSKLVSLNPARLMRIDENVGSIEEGKFADFVIMDNDLTVKQVYVNGIS
jgi:hypothetical protein